MHLLVRVVVLLTLCQIHVHANDLCLEIRKTIFQSHDYHNFKMLCSSDSFGIDPVFTVTSARYRPDVVKSAAWLELEIILRKYIILYNLIVTTVSNLSSDSWRAHQTKYFVYEVLEVVLNHVISMGGPIGVQ